MKFGIPLTRTHVALWEEVVLRAEELGYESVWLPDHLVFSTDMAGSPHPGAPAGVSVRTPLFDCPAYLSYLAARTSNIRLGTFVYVYALRHPLIAARGFATADLLSGGRIEVGVGAGWLESEWRAAGLDFRSRGARLDEAIEVTRRLWGEDLVAHQGSFWQWEELGFEPKPVQAGGPPILVGGESSAALDRAARLGDGWMSMPHTLESAKVQIERVLARHAGGPRRDGTFDVTICCAHTPTLEEVDEFERLGVARLIVAPWNRVRSTVQGMTEFADRMGLRLRNS